MRWVGLEWSKKQIEIMVSDCFKILLLFLIPLAVSGQRPDSGALFLPSPGAGERQIPDWFLNPEPDEYVGVSLPSYSLEESALFAALLSYCAREEMEGIRKREVIGYSKKYVTSHDVLLAKNLIGIFEVSRKFLNEYNELFVAVKIRKDNGIFNFESDMDSEEEIVDKRMKHSESKKHVSFEYADKMGRHFGFIYDYMNKNGDCRIVVENMITKEIFDSTPHYSYRNKGNTPQVAKERVQFSCMQSLGFAYLQGMWALIEKQKKWEKKAERDEVDELLGSLGESVVLKKLDYSMSVENNHLIFTIPE